MNLLKQTALILGLTSLVLGGWAIYRNFGNKVSILFSLFCFVVSVWALSFVSYATLGGYLSHDIHLAANVFLAPAGIAVLYSILFKRDDRFSQYLQVIALVGALVLGTMISFSMARGEVLQRVVLFFPALIVIEYFYLMTLDFIFREPLNTDFISPSKRVASYFGLGVSLIFCSFDHIPALGFVVPSIGNVFFTLYLVFASQMITPLRLFKIEVILSRFFAILILALIISAFFGLLYPYISESFPLFLFNSFLISFAVLALWNPLLTFFRYLTRRLMSEKTELIDQKIEALRAAIAAATHLDLLKRELIRMIQDELKLGSARVLFQVKGVSLPIAVKNYFDFLVSRKITPILHQDILRMERYQVFTESQRYGIDLLFNFLHEQEAGIVFPVFYETKIVSLILIQPIGSTEDWGLSLRNYSKLFDAVQEFGPALVRLTQIEKESEKDRLIFMGEMAAGLAHEVRNPLGAIRGAAELIPDRTSPWAQVIQEEVERLNRLVSQFLDFAQDPKEKRESISLNEVAKVMVTRFQSTLPGHIEMQLQIDSASISVLAVPDHLRQVLWNLYQNSLKALESTSQAKIQVRVDRNQISLSDNGSGMSDEVKERVFQPFFTSFKDGTGLGLSISERLIHFNGGQIKIDSVLNQGTTVTLILEESHER